MISVSGDPPLVTDSDHGFTSERTNNFGTLQWLRAKRG
jgi:hypothetical protein